MQSGGHLVRCYQYVNNLKLFTNTLIFYFDENDIYYDISHGDLILELDLDTNASVDENVVVNKFVDRLIKDYDNFLIWPKVLIDTCCFDVEFGYFDLNAGLASSEMNFSKVWKVSISNEEYPYAFINDNNLEIFRYNNGIITGK